MNSYTSEYADYYDYIYAEKKYSQEALFVHNIIQEFSKIKVKNILELACGTGTHAFEMENFGYNIIASDKSELMLNKAKKKAKDMNSKVHFKCFDMCSFNLGKKFDVIYSMFDSIGYVQTDENILKVLKNVHNHLNNEGLFIFEFWHKDAMINGFDSLRVLKLAIPDAKLMRISRTKLIQMNNLAEVAYDLYVLNKDKSYSEINETHINRYFTQQEMQDFVSASQFRTLKCYSGFTKKTNIDKNTWHIIYVAKKIIKD